MAGPQQTPPPTGEEEEMSRRAAGADSGDSFASRDKYWRNLDRMYEDRDEKIANVQELIRRRNESLEKQRAYEARLQQAMVDSRQMWVGVDGSSVEFTYDEFLDYMEQHTDNDDRDVVVRVRSTLDKHPGAISFAEKAGFTFVREDDIDALDADRTEANLVAKAEKIRFLNDIIVAYNEGDYIPYYDRDAAYDSMLDPKNEENTDMPFKGIFVRDKSSELDDEVFARLGEEYGTDGSTMKKWYEQADRVLLAYERDHLLDPTVRVEEGLKIDADYESLFKLSGSSAAMQSQINKDGMHVDGFFEKIQGSADAFEDMHEANSGIFRNASRVDKAEFKAREAKDQLDAQRLEAEDMVLHAPTLSGGIQDMYAKEMDRYRSGFTQQAPLMWDMAKRWSKEKTRFFDSRQQAKEQMRDQKWTEKTGINERGIKTEGSLGDFFKSIVRECRRELYKSGVSDFSLVGDTDRLLMAIGMDAAQRSFEKARFKLAGLQDMKLEREMNKWGNSDPKKSKDTANYTRAIQIASEAKHGTRFNGTEVAARDYDGRDNNPADVMAGWDDANEWSKDKKQQERNLQNLIDDKGYNTNDDENDGPRLLGGPEAE